MKKTALVLIIVGLFIGRSAHGQTGAFQHYCEQGAESAVTSGLRSSNYLNGVIPLCTVTVYLTGTTTLATLYADKNNTPLSNPTTASFDGQYLFYASTNAGLDVKMSGGFAPNTYATPVTLIDVYVNSSFTPVAQTATIQTNGVNNASQILLNFQDSATLSATNPSGGIEQYNMKTVNASPGTYGDSTHTLTATVDQYGRIPSLSVNAIPTAGNAALGLAGCDGTTTTCSAGLVTSIASGQLSMQVNPPVGGQYVFVPAGTPTIVVNQGTASASTSSASLGLGGGGSFEIDVTINWANPVLPSYIVPANVTSVYAIATSSQTNFHYYNGILHAPGQSLVSSLDCGGSSVLGSGTDGWTIQQVTTLTGLTGATFGAATCAAHIGANYSGGGNLIVPLLGYLVYYTGTAPPASSNVIVSPPLNYNNDSKTLSLVTPLDVAADTGVANAYAVSIPWLQFAPGATVKFMPAHAQTLATPTLTLNGNAPYNIVGPTGLPLALGDMSTSVPAIVVYNGASWTLTNPQVLQPTSGSGKSQTVVASATTIAPTARFFHVSGTTTISTITAPASCVVTGTMCQITMIPDGLWSTTTGGNIAIASTAVVSKALIMTYDPATTTWFPSY